MPLDVCGGESALAAERVGVGLGLVGGDVHAVGVAGEELVVAVDGGLVAAVGLTGEP